MRTWAGRRPDLLARLAVLSGLALFVVGTYVVLVLGGGVLIGRTSSPNLALSVVATATVALGFGPARGRLESGVRRVVGGGTPSPYDVLSRFSETVTGGYAAPELPDRMAVLIAQGTGASWAQVWLTVQDRLVLAATWPDGAGTGLDPPGLGPEATEPTNPGLRTLPVRHGGQVYGVFRLQEHPDRPLTAVGVRLFSGLAAQAGLVLRHAALRADLTARHEDLARQAVELQASRERLIETQDAERRRLERDIHDGAQQHLVALAVNLRLAETVAARDPERVKGVLRQQADAAREAINTLSELSRGIYPRLLADEGLVAALRAAVATSPVVVVVSGEPQHLPAATETALYFFAMEAVQNAAKHSSASRITVLIDRTGDQKRLVVTDDGTGFDHKRAERIGTGSGLASMRDRIEAIGGTVAMTSRPGRGTAITAMVPSARAAVPAPTVAGDAVLPRTTPDLPVG